MNLNIITPMQIPMGMEKETVLLAQELRHRYHDFFDWMQEGEKDDGSLLEGTFEQLHRDFEGGGGHGSGEQGFPSDQGQETERWLLSKWDIEYFYALSRPADVVCSCPFGWMEKVERLIDQQYPMFGIERFPDLYEKAAHMAYLLVRNEIFPSYNEGIAVLAALVLLQRNGEEVQAESEDLKRFVSAIKVLIKEGEEISEGEERAVRVLGQLLKG